METRTEEPCTWDIPTILEAFEYDPAEVGACFQDFCTHEHMYDMANEEVRACEVSGNAVPKIAWLTLESAIKGMRETLEDYQAYLAAQALYRLMHYKDVFIKDPEIRLLACQWADELGIQFVERKGGFIRRVGQ